MSPFLFSKKCFCAALRAECYTCTTASPQICLSISTTPRLCTRQLSKGLVELSLDAELNPGMQWQASVLTQRGFGGHHQVQAVREEAVRMETQSEGQRGTKPVSSCWSRSRGREGMDGMASIRSCCLDTKSCLTVCDPMDFSPPDSMGFSWQEHQSGLPLPLPGSFHYPGIKPVSLTLTGTFSITESSGKPSIGTRRDKNF